MKNNKKIKIIGFLIILIIVIILILSIALLKMRKTSNDVNNTQVDNLLSNQESSANEEIMDEEMQTLADTDKNIKSISSYTEYFTLKNIIENFNTNCKNLSTTESDINIRGTELSEEELQEEVQKEVESLKRIGKEYIYDCLSADYISEFAITKDAITKKFGTTTKNSIVIDSIYYVNSTNTVSTYFISGFNVGDKTTEFKMAITLDVYNETFCIYPEEYLKKHGYDNLTLGKELDLKIENIEKKTYNNFEYEEATDEDMCSEYITMFALRLRYNIDGTYEKLEEEYRNQRFGSKAKFEQYLEDNANNINYMYLNKYTVLSRGSYKDYVCLDSMGDYYIFRQQDGSLCDYTVLLDDYTVMSSSDLASYASLSNVAKATQQVNNFIKKVNTKDYQAIYNNLDDTFKSNNYKDVNSLKTAIKNNLYEFNSIEISNYEETDNTIAFECKVTNEEDSTQSKNMTIIINIGEGTNFTMSFSFE